MSKKRRKRYRHRPAPLTTTNILRMADSAYQSGNYELRIGAHKFWPISQATLKELADMHIVFTKKPDDYYHRADIRSHFV